MAYATLSLVKAIMFVSDKFMYIIVISYNAGMFHNHLLKSITPGEQLLIDHHRNLKP